MLRVFFFLLFPFFCYVSRSVSPSPLCDGQFDEGRELSPYVLTRGRKLSMMIRYGKVYLVIFSMIFYDLAAILDFKGSELHSKDIS